MYGVLIISVKLHLILCLSVVYRCFKSSREAWMRLESHGMKLEEERREDGQVGKEENQVVVNLSVHRSSGETRPLHRSSGEGSMASFGSGSPPLER